jgi:hypothetical protein
MPNLLAVLLDVNPPPGVDGRLHPRKLTKRLRCPPPTCGLNWGVDARRKIESCRKDCNQRTKVKWHESSDYHRRRQDARLWRFQSTRCLARQRNSSSSALPGLVSSANLVPPSPTPFRRRCSPRGRRRWRRPSAVRPRPSARRVGVFPLDRASVGRAGVDGTTESASQVRYRGEDAVGAYGLTNSLRPATSPKFQKKSAQILR